MRIWVTITAATLLAGCVVPDLTAVDDDEAGAEADNGPAFTAPRGTSPAALAALPAGMSPAMLIRDGNGCYGLAIEATEPPSGIPLRDDTGAQVCDA